MPLKEKLLIDRIRRAAARGARSAGTGIGDDCAVLRIPRGHEALVTTDFSLEDVHFRREWHPADSVGPSLPGPRPQRHRRHGRRPAAAFLSLALPPELPQKWVDQFIGGLAEAGGAVFGPARGRRHRAIARRNSGGHRGARLGARREGDSCALGQSREICSM